MLRDKDNPTNLCMQARALVAEGNLTAAIASYETIIKNFPSFALAYADRGTAHAMAEQYAAAIADLKMAIDLGYKESSVYTTLATIASSSGNYREALDYFSVAISLNPANPLIYYNRAAAFRALGDTASAIRDLEKCLEFGPDQNFQDVINQRLAELGA
jgi:tetratricopeptide (TPR) repeat protein